MDWRYYNPQNGKWTTRDPLGFPSGDTNLYRYVNNAPTNALDPNGLQATPFIRNKTISIKTGDLGKLDVFKFTGQNNLPTMAATFDTSPLTIAQSIDLLNKAIPGICLDHYNWYQTVTYLSLPPGGLDLIDARTGEERKTGRSYIDPPNGGTVNRGIAGRKTRLWADNRPWYWNETPPPKPFKNKIPMAQDDLSSHIKGNVLEFQDTPIFPDGTEAVFHTWLVALDKNGGHPTFLSPGFMWSLTVTPGKIAGQSIFDMEFLGELAEPELKGYGGAIGRFYK